MTDSPMVSVLMPCYRETAAEFSEALDSILKQTYTQIEVVVIFDDPDNKSLYEIARDRAAFDGRIRLVKNERNLGLPSALARGFEASSGDYICRMDSDDISEVQRIERQLEYLKENGLDLVGSYLNAIDEEGETLYLVNSIPTKSESVNRALGIRNCVPHPAWLGKRAVFELGYRDIPLAEDYDLLLRAVLGGFSIGNVPEPLIRYRMTTNSISRNSLYEQFLVSRILSSAYNEGLILEAEMIVDTVSFQRNKNAGSNYLRANGLFNNGLQMLHSGKILHGLSQLICIPFVSGEYCRNLFNMARVVAIKIME